MRMTSKGRVTIPVGIREKMGLLPGAEVEFQISGDTVCLKKVKSRRRSNRLCCGAAVLTCYSYSRSAALHHCETLAL